MRNNADVHEPKIVSSTDALLVTELALSIHGYASLAVDDDLQPQMGVRSSGYRSVQLDNLCTVSNKVVTFYYDVVNTLVYDTRDGNEATTCDVLYLEEITLATPSSETNVFLGWNTQANGAGENYSANGKYVLDGEDVASPTLSSGVTRTLYAHWATPTVSTAKGRLLDRISGTSNTVSIAQNGAYTLYFALEDEENCNLISPNNLNLVSTNKFPAGTKLTLICYPSESGNMGATQYYYIVPEATNAINLASFVSFSNGTNFNSGNTSNFRCQVCAEYAGMSFSGDQISLSLGSAHENNTKVSVTFTAAIAKPAGNIALSSTVTAKPNYQGVLTVSNITGFSANQSNAQHTSGTLTSSKPVVVMCMTDESGNDVPFTNSIEVKINDEVVKSAGAGTEHIVWRIPFTVANKSYSISITGITNASANIHFYLCSAKSTNTDDTMHAMAQSGSQQIDHASVALTGTIPVVPLYEQYKISAQIGQNSMWNHIFDKSTCAGVTVHFSMEYSSPDETNEITVEVYKMEYNQQTGKAERSATPLNWTTIVNMTSNTVKVTIPRNVDATETPNGTTYCFVFTLNNRVQCTYYLIITNN